MAEPAATVTIAKAKQNNVNLKIIADLQDIYQKQEKTKVHIHTHMYMYTCICAYIHIYNI